MNAIFNVMSVEVVWLVFTLGIYFLPTTLAFGQQHRQAVPILLVNLFLGWTFIGWVVALVWAAMKERKTV